MLSTVETRWNESQTFIFHAVGKDDDSHEYECKSIKALEQWRYFLCFRFRAGKIVVHLNGRLNKCGVIAPRFDVSIRDMEKWQNNLLPSRQFGYIVLTTSAGIMDHEEARRKHTGGKILGFFF